MAREKPGYREALERLDSLFPEREIIKQPELAKFLGVSTKTVQRKMQNEYNERLKGYPKVLIARALVDV